jgi:hypothetical protein
MTLARHLLQNGLFPAGFPFLTEICFEHRTAGQGRTVRRRRAREIGARRDVSEDPLRGAAETVDS